jgi:hypothetical protein
MEARKVRDFLLKKVDIKDDLKTVPDVTSEELYWLRIGEVKEKTYKANICIHDNGLTSFVLPAPWLIDQTVESRLAYDVLKEIGIKLDLKMYIEDVFSTEPNPTVEQLEKGYSLANYYDKALKSKAYKALTSQLELIQ